MRSLIVAIAIGIGLNASLARAADPDCAGVERWPTAMAFVHLKNAGVTDNDRMDFTKTKTVRTRRSTAGG